VEGLHRALRSDGERREHLEEGFHHPWSLDVRCRREESRKPRLLLDPVLESSVGRAISVDGGDEDEERLDVCSRDGGGRDGGCEGSRWTRRGLGSENEVLLAVTEFLEDGEHRGDEVGDEGIDLGEDVPPEVGVDEVLLPSSFRSRRSESSSSGDDAS